jgi:hypothetical protein
MEQLEVQSDAMDKSFCVVIKGMITPTLSSSLSDEIIVAVFVFQKGVSVEVSHMINNTVVYKYIYVFEH